MADLFYQFYEKELSELQNSLYKYSKTHPKEAKDLHIQQDTINDPSLVKMIESVAFLTARMHYDLDNQKKEINHELLSILFPLYHKIIPSIAYVEYQSNHTLDAITLPKGLQFEVDSEEGECIFTVPNKVILNAIEIKEIKIKQIPFDFTLPEKVKMSNFVIQLKLITTNNKAFNQSQFSDICLFINGFDIITEQIIDFLLNEDIYISFSDISVKKHRFLSKKKLINRIENEKINYLNINHNEMMGYHQIFEYFNCKGKKCFFDLIDSSLIINQFEQNEICLNIFSKNIPKGIRKNIDISTFKINVFPIINEFNLRSEPIIYKENDLSAPINASVDNKKNIQISHVNSIELISKNGIEPLPHFFDIKTSFTTNAKWQAKLNKHEKYELIIDNIVNDCVVNANLTCTNINTVCSIEDEIKCKDNFDIKGSIKLLYPPSKPIKANKSSDDPHAMVNLLSCNINTLSHSEDSLLTCKYLLLLLCRIPKEVELITKLKEIRFKSIISPVRIRNKNLMSMGTEIIVTIDIGNHNLFFRILNIFFMSMCGFDKFIQLTIYKYGVDKPIKTFSKHHGSQSCL